MSEEFNECCVANPRQGDAWYERMTILYFIVVSVKSLDEVVVLKCFGNDSAKFQGDDGKYCFDYSKAVVVNRQWIRDTVTYSGNHQAFVADCRTSETIQKICSEYAAYVLNTPSFASLVKEKQADVFKAQQELLELLNQCPHEHLEKKHVYHSGGYDHRSESIQFDECKVCGTTFNKTVEYGGFQ